MYLLKLAFDNLRFNVKRTLSLVLIIAVASSAIVLYQGYVEYCAQGMMTGFIQGSGHLQVASSSYWSSDDDGGTYISGEELEQLFDVLSLMENVRSHDAVFSFNGLAGNGDHSAIFWGRGYDNPEKFISPKNGIPVFAGDEKILLGSVLSQKLHLDFPSESVVSIMGNSPEYGLCLSSAEVSGIVETGIPQNDAGLLVTSRSYALSLLEMENSASFVQVYLSDSDVSGTVQKLYDAFSARSLDFSIRTWKELNPSFDQINNLNQAQFFMISIILGVLIFIALMQTLLTSYLERLGEFGTLEAVGLNKTGLAMMLFSETVYLFAAGTLISVAISFGTNWLCDLLDISMNPPGYDVSYRLMFMFEPRQIFTAFAFVFSSCVLATLYPAISICRNSAIKLINHR